MDSALIDFIKYIWPIMLLPIAWILRQMADLRKEHYETKIHAAETYVPRSDYRDDLKSLHLKIDAYASKQDSNIQKILDKLENKKDKYD